jgi:hypothetical protein
MILFMSFTAFDLALKDKDKADPVYAMKSYTGRRCIAVLILTPVGRWS